ncbi:NUDIX domain-containing protein [Mesorhizobium sp. B2-8-5]|uniref:NUDIX hydrolase n=1 Tax=Mesorhizobium sp. B2-8-5 TaxID=2589903 RepID=UPI00299F9100|nr:NUDIX domain-containing protein [Mesorhizobium sp. B2-8-5]
MTSSHSRSARARTIRIAAAVIRDDDARLLLVRKRGTSAFMQAGGKIEPDELPAAALAGELREELGVAVDPAEAFHLGSFSAPAVNEPDAPSSRPSCSNSPSPASRSRRQRSRR